MDNVLSSGDSGVGDTTTGGQSASGASDCESGSTEKCAERSHHFPMFERQSSFIHRERMIAHSTALESITINVDSASSHPGADDQTTYGMNQGGNMKIFNDVSFPVKVFSIKYIILLLLTNVLYFSVRC